MNGTRNVWRQLHRETISNAHGTVERLIRRRRAWRYREVFEYATLKWVDWFSHRRLLETIGHLPPAEREALYYKQQNQAKKVS